MSKYKEQIAGVTKAGKKVAFRVPEGKSLYEIYFVGGGQVPQALKGSWTDGKQITNAVKAYLFSETKATLPSKKSK